MRGDVETSLAIEQREKARAGLRARIAARPHNPWVERERYTMVARGEDEPVKRRGRPRQVTP